MAVLITPLADVDIIADPTGTNCIAEVSGKVVRIATQKIIDMVSTQVADPNKSDFAQTVVDITVNMNHVVEQMEVITGRLDASDENIGNLQNNYTELDEHVTNIESNVNNNTESINQINEDISSINSKVSVLETSSSSLSSSVTSLTSRMSSAESKINNYETRLQKLEGYLTLLNIIANGQ